MDRMGKKGQLAGSVDVLRAVAIVFVVTGLVIAFGLQILGDVKTDMTADSSEANATQDTIDGVAKFSAKLPIIATVVVAVVIIGLLFYAFRSK